MSDEKLVLCIKWGTMYGPEYVNVMYGMVSRNLSGPFRYLRAPKQPRGTRIITFPGKPKPPMAGAGKWSEKDPARTPLEHLAFCLKKDGTSRKRKAYKRFLMPSPWVAQHWKP